MPPPPNASVVETHLSTVILLGERAYKLPKPVRLPFVDQSTPARRHHACLQEVALNRRLTDDVYLGVLDVLRDGEAVDHLIEMRRLPDGRRLSTLARDHAEDAPDAVDAVARRVAAFHAAADRSPRITAGASPEAVTRLWTDNLAEMAAFAGPVVDPAELAAVGEAANTYLAGRHRLLERRQADGMVVDGHGDLLADDIFCLPDGPRILDCLAFDEHLRHGDVLLDLAFLAMDLEAKGRGDLSALLVRRYVAYTGEHHPASLADHYIAYRALVRSKIACLKVAQEGRQAEARARGRLALARRHLDRARVRLVLVGGAPGSGKTTVASALADRTGWALLDSDELRKDLSGLGHHEPARAEFGTGIYRPEATAVVYDHLLDQAARLLAQGESVVLDASWTAEAHRRRARDVAEQQWAEIIELRCTAPPATLASRLAVRAERGGTVSDADADIAHRLARAADPWPEAVVVDNGADIERAAAAALEAVG